MTLTRSKTGNTPRRPENPGMVETPGRQRRGRKSTSAGDDISENGTIDIPNDTTKKSSKPARNGSVKSPRTTKSPERSSTTSPSQSRAKSPKRPRKSSTNGRKTPDSRYNPSGEKEFGGALGVTAIMIGFPLLMYYMWIGATYFDGKFPTPLPNQTFGEFIQYLGHLAYTGAFPSLKAWTIFWSFAIFEAVCYLYLPGIYTHGKPLKHLGGQKLQYYCSGVLSWYLTIGLAIALHFSGLFSLYTLLDDFGPLMSVAIISGFAISIVAYVSALARGAQHRMSGNHIYDFFMGAELNPRLFKWLDFKMFCEVRLPWFILFLVTLGACTRQYEQYGYVSGELAFLLMAHFLYANACCKAEELIPTTWDMYYEKWGFMIIFWNIAGVPLSYCHCTIFLANHHPETYRWPRPVLAGLFIVYLLAYWVWDTAGSQKNYFRAEQRGTARLRKTFPQLPFRVVKNPTTIPVESGDDLLCDGWYKYARKIHYTCDLIFALSWAFVTGFESPFPWFYPTFFAVMISHRAVRDIERCRARYGKAWLEYETRVPYLFIPYVL